jgi:HrpA-like RNA helicase
MNTSKNELSFNKVIPVEYYRKAILSTILKFQVTIVQAETGSGKTIFIPKILYLSGFKKIIISQTKRTATIKAAKFLSSVFNQKIGDLIGYSVRFEKKSKKTTRIKFVTDGILFQNLLNNSFFEKNVCIILDEFHERTFHTDLLMGF